MALSPLALHRARVRPGRPLPFAIRDTAGRLLLARGQLLESEDQLQTLLDREANIDDAELAGLAEPGDALPRLDRARGAELVGHWNNTFDQVGRVLRAAPSADFTRALDRAAQPVLALVERDPDLALLQVVRQEAGGEQSYASRHAVHTAIASGLAARRLGWSEDELLRACRAALTMNLAMVELQNRLATQVTPPTPLQRQQIHNHPERGAQMLELAGVTDRDWLDAVAGHHEQPSGGGYPTGCSQAHPLARLLMHADVFTAKFSGRAARTALPADQAARQLFQAHAGDPMVAALIKEFGLYPPGTAVRLKSGELGLVVRRGECARTPLVMVVLSRSGEPLLTPLRRHTGEAAHAVVAIVPPAALRVRIGLEKLIEASEG